MLTKREVLTVLASLADDEFVMLQHAGGDLSAVDEITIQQEEPPIFAIVSTKAVDDKTYKTILEDRARVEQEKQDAAAAEVKRITDEAEAATAAQAEQETAFKQAVRDEVARQIAERNTGPVA